MEWKLPTEEFLSSMAREWIKKIPRQGINKKVLMLLFSVILKLMYRILLLHRLITLQEQIQVQMSHWLQLLNILNLSIMQINLLTFQYLRIMVHLLMMNLIHLLLHHPIQSSVLMKSSMLLQSQKVMLQSMQYLNVCLMQNLRPFLP